MSVAVFKNGQKEDLAERVLPTLPFRFKRLVLFEELNCTCASDNLQAYLLLNAGGKANPSAADIKNLLNTVGVETNEERVASLIAALGEKDIAQLVEEGKEKLSSVPTGGAGAAAAGGAAAGGASEEAKEEAKEEEKEESDDDMGFGLFD
ncbi:60S acidic ribosomal protein P2 [Apophysomyces sp. BC1034]|nr:60S acidic ribosomal protein P2 [Apophysomyces sp. BC1015]KAG0181629.1 60S acidic ribosomal protein P2 [Apophysomyces sp. BC1021]KAG0192313.1 60S acidic ribosomal protein P2 [Apophysomyces sp. BC1034]